MVEQNSRLLYFGTLHMNTAKQEQNRTKGGWKLRTQLRSRH